MRDGQFRRLRRARPGAMQRAGVISFFCIPRCADRALHRERVSPVWKVEWLKSSSIFHFVKNVFLRKIIRLYNQRHLVQERGGSNRDPLPEARPHGRTARDVTVVRDHPLVRDIRAVVHPHAHKRTGYGERRSSPAVHRSLDSRGRPADRLRYDRDTLDVPRPGGTYTCHLVKLPPWERKSL